MKFKEGLHMIGYLNVAGRSLRQDGIERYSAFRYNPPGFESFKLSICLLQQRYRRNGGGQSVYVVAERCAIYSVQSGADHRPLPVQMGYPVI